MFLGKEIENYQENHETNEMDEKRGGFIFLYFLDMVAYKDEIVVQ
jgi:hypothetical protein